MATITLNPLRSRGNINRNIYGHFSEHLGRCIYQGLYVGEDSAIPNVRGIRSDAVQALKEIKVPVLRWPGGREPRWNPRRNSYIPPIPPFPAPCRCRHWH